MCTQGLLARARLCMLQLGFLPQAGPSLIQQRLRQDARGPLVGSFRGSFKEYAWRTCLITYLIPGWPCKRKKITVLWQFLNQAPSSVTRKLCYRALYRLTHAYLGGVWLLLLIRSCFIFALFSRKTNMLFTMQYIAFLESLWANFGAKYDFQ